MNHSVSGPVRRIAARFRPVLGSAFCRIGLAAAAGFGAGACQSDGTPTQNQLTGTLAVTVSGLPDGSPAGIVVTGPGGYRRTVNRSETISGLATGTYAIAAAEVEFQGDRFAPDSPSQSVNLSAQGVTAAAVGFQALTGRIQLSITGIPAGSGASVEVLGPAGYHHVAAGSELLAGLLPGAYTVSTGTVSVAGTSYLALPSSQPVTVAAGATTPVGVTYVASSGALSVTVTGLSGGAAAVAVSGPGGFSASLTGSETLNGLAPGLYQVNAAAVVVGGTTYSPQAPNQSATVTAGSTAAVQVTYSGGGGGSGPDLRVDAVYLTQAVQRYDGTVPLIAGRDAYLRVFALANETNSVGAAVRVRLYQGASLVQTYTITSGPAAVPTAPNEGSLAASWNVMVPGSLVQPGLQVLADVDPGNAVPESNETNNSYPLNGVPRPFEVRALPVFSVRMVPVLQQANGLVGNVTAGNLESFLADLKQMLPVAAYDADIRAVYTTTAPAVQSGNGNSAWNTILNELLALKIADGSSRYYYGVVKTTYTSGVAGLGFVGGSSRTAVGWDFLPSGSNIMAHELGHNMGRQHAPCGSVAGPDPGFPHPGGTIGVWGLQLTGLVLRSPATADLMGYCQPTWISDYNWTAMVDYRTSTASGEGTAEALGLLVWGRITSDRIILEPSFQVSRAGTSQPVSGAGQIELLDPNGVVLRTVRFDASPVGDLPGAPERQFAVVVPAQVGSQPVRGLRVRTAGLAAAVVDAAQPEGDPELSVTRAGPDRISVRWNGARYPMALVRDGATGRILSFARGGNAVLWSRAETVDLQFSSGTRTVNRRERILR